MRILTTVPLALAAVLLGAMCSTVGGQAVVPAPTLRYTIDDIHRDVVVELSPLDLPAHASHHDIRQPVPQVLVVPISGWFEGYFGEVVDSAGHPAPSILIHHLNLIIPQRRELFSTIMQRMGAAGAETPPVELPEIFGHPVLGYPIDKGDTLLITLMLNNPTDVAYHNARLQVHLRYAPRDIWPSPISIFPFYLDVMPPAGPHGYDLPAGHSQKSWEGRPAVKGRILAIGGHLHQYGVDLRLTDVTTGRVIWRTAPVTDAERRILRIPTKTYWWRLGIPIVPDHTYRITATYDNPTGHAIPDGAMGAIGGVFLPSNMSRWPPVDPTTAEYKRDVTSTYDTQMDDMDDMQSMDEAQSPTRLVAGTTGDPHAGMRKGMLNTSIPTRRPAQTQ
jgi:hypothetical protein